MTPPAGPSEQGGPAGGREMPPAREGDEGPVQLDRPFIMFRPPGSVLGGLAPLAALISQVAVSGSLR